MLAVVAIVQLNLMATWTCCILTIMLLAELAFASVSTVLDGRVLGGLTTLTRSIGDYAAGTVFATDPNNHVVYVFSGGQILTIPAVPNGEGDDDNRGENAANPLATLKLKQPTGIAIHPTEPVGVHMGACLHVFGHTMGCIGSESCRCHP
jgi:hypothetical protein